MRRLLRTLVLTGFLVAAAGPAHADKIHLKNGNTLDGQVLSETATHYIVKTRFGEQRISKADVVRIEKVRGVLDEYEDRKKQISADDADGLYELGVWCREAKLRRESIAAFEAAVAANPDHEKARTELGFAKYEGKWIPVEERDRILADIAKREAEILAGLALAEPVSDAKLRYEFRPSKEFEKEEPSAGRLVFTGPELGKAPVTIEFRAGGDGTLDEAAKAIAKEIGEKYEDARQGEPADAKLAGLPARRLVFGYVRADLAADDLPMERHELFAATPAGLMRFTLECREGYAERLAPHFAAVTGSLKVLDKAPDVVSKEHGFSLSFPDDGYATTDTFPIQVRGPNGQPMALVPKGSIIVGRGQSPTLLVVVPGKAAEGAAEPITLQSLRDSINTLEPAPGFVETTGDAQETKVAGQSALRGGLLILKGGLGSGRWCVVQKGDRYFRILFLNIANQMGDKYVDEDFGKFLESFRID